MDQPAALPDWASALAAARRFDPINTAIIAASSRPPFPRMRSCAPRAVHICCRKIAPLVNGLLTKAAQHKGAQHSSQPSVTSTTLLLRLGGALKTNRNRAGARSLGASGGRRWSRQPMLRPVWSARLSVHGPTGAAWVYSPLRAAASFPLAPSRPGMERARGLAGHHLRLLALLVLPGKGVRRAGYGRRLCKEAPFILPGDGLSSSSSLRNELARRAGSSSNRWKTRSQYRSAAGSLAYPPIGRGSSCRGSART